MSIRIVLTVCVATCVGIPLSAHDFWLAAHPWAPGSRVSITANVGEHFPTGTEYPIPDRLGSWSVIGPDGTIDLDGGFHRDGNTLVADVVLPTPGAYLAMMTVNPRITTMQGPSFTSYLLEEGLERVVTARQQAGLSDNMVTERYARYAKVAVRNGGGSGRHLTWPVGFPAEFVPMTDPTVLSAGQLLTLQLLADRRPVSGAVVAARPSDGGHPVMARTDATGHVTLRIDRDGAWLVRTVHMVTGAQAGVPDVEWDSYWATFAFHTARR